MGRSLPRLDSEVLISRVPGSDCTVTLALTSLLDTKLREDIERAFCLLASLSGYMFCSVILSRYFGLRLTAEYFLCE